MTASIKPLFLVERQGKKFALYGGLVDAAHSEEIGLAGITTDLVQIANEDNEQTWIFKAFVTTKKGVFVGYGDANPTNVSRQMLTSSMRLAETRAKARALRDAVNAGALVAFEELDDSATDESDQPFGDEVPESVPNRAPVPAPRLATSAPVDIASAAQVRMIYAIGRGQHKLDEQKIEELSTKHFGVGPTDLTKRQASDLITYLKNGAA